MLLNRLTAEIPTQQQKPIRIGLPPDLMSLTILVLRPIAAIAITIKNLLTVLNGEKKASETPNDVATVVMSDAAMKNRIKNGKIFFILMDAPPALLLLTCTNERENKRNRYNCQRPCEFYDRCRIERVAVVNPVHALTRPAG